MITRDYNLLLEQFIYQLKQDFDYNGYPLSVNKIKEKLYTIYDYAIIYYEKINTINFNNLIKDLKKMKITTKDFVISNHYDYNNHSIAVFINIQFKVDIIENDLYEYYFNLCKSYLLHIDNIFEKYKLL